MSQRTRDRHRQRREQRRLGRIHRDHPGKYRILRDEVGDPCPRCGLPTQVREHDGLKAKHLRQSVVYSRWFYCTNPHCKTSTIVPARFKILNPVLLGDTWDETERREGER